MPTLLKIKYEIVAQALALGKSQGDAYRAAGYKYKPANASRLCRSPAIEARVQEIVAERTRDEAKSREIGVRGAGLTEEWIMSGPKHVIDLSIRGLPVYGRGGNPTGLYKSNLEAAINGLRTAAQIAGLLIQKREIGEPGAFARMTDAELADALLIHCKAMGLSDGSMEEIRTSVVAL